MKNKKLIFIIFASFISLTAITGLLLQGKGAASQEDPNFTSLSCEELEKRSEIEHAKLNQDCNADNDCILVDSGWCGSCMNKDADKDSTAALRNIYDAGVKKGCFPEFECTQVDCRCIENKCQKVKTTSKSSQNTGLISPKNCNDYKMPMTEEEIATCICPEGYVKLNRLSGAYCATNSQKPCRVHSDCPNGEHCISTDMINWFCTGQFTGCYYDDPDNPESQVCVD